MTKIVHRAAAAAAGAALLSAVGAVTTTEAASAVDMTGAYGGVVFRLDETDTAGVLLQGGPEGAKLLCDENIQQAQDVGLVLSDWDIANCQTALYVCAADAVSNNRSLSGVLFFADSYGCLVRETSVSAG